MGSSSTSILNAFAILSNRLVLLISPREEGKPTLLIGALGLVLLLSSQEEDQPDLIRSN